jgi:hypothetical protein
LTLGAVGQLFSLVFQAQFFGSLPTDLPAGPPDAPNIAAMFGIMRIVMTILAIGFAGLFAWIAWRLTTPAIKAEFA